MSSSRRLPALAAGLALVTTGLAVTAAPSATAAGPGLVISEVYGGGGNSGSVFRSDFVELRNTSASPVSLDGLTLQYRSTGGGVGGSLALTGTVQPGKHFLVKAADGADASKPALPTPDAQFGANMSGTGGQVLLFQGSTFTGTGNLAGKPNLLDMVGWSSGTNSYETAPAPGTGNSTAVSRDAAGTDTDNNATDFTAGAPVPENSASGGTDPDPNPEPEPADVTIAEIQGTGATSPLAGDVVTTRGVVTATYPTGGFNGFYVQTAGTGTGDDATPGASDGLFVYGASIDEATLSVGDHVEVTGEVGEYTQTVSGQTSSLTQVRPATAADVAVLAEPAPAPTALATTWFPTDAAREAHEGELVELTGPFTVTNSYNTHQYGEIGLAAGTTPLLAPTEVEDAQTGDTAAVAADNAARLVTLDDGRTSNFTGAASGEPMSWLTETGSVRTGAAATLHAPFVVDHRNGLYKIQPTAPVAGAGAEVATFEDTREPLPQDVGGDIRVATFNVLNYFPTTGAEFVSTGLGSCTYYKDRAGAPTTVNSCNPDGPRGAADEENLQRQQAKIVDAINKLGASIVGLEEIENSAKFGKDRDFALGRLVEALNAAAGADTWEYVASPPAEQRPAVAEEDVIRTAYIYKPADVEPVGESRILRDEVNFDNAREPLAQAFKGTGAPDRDAFALIVNHFKSKGSGVDDGTGQGNANPDRIGQAEALSAFAAEFAADRGTEAVLLAGDFNSYTMEDPMQVLYEDGYEAIESDTEGEETYVFGGLVGSLDHVLGNAAALEMVTGADVWDINADEPVGYEYGRFNANVTDLYAEHPFRSSDHDPEIVGLDLPDAVATTVTGTADEVAYGTEGAVEVRVASENPVGGTVNVLDGEQVLGTATVAEDGSATVVLPARSLGVGSHDLGLRYSGDAANQPSTGTVTVTVVKAAPAMTVTVSPDQVTTQTPVRLTVDLSAPGQTVTGWVGVTVDGDHQARGLTDGRAVFDLDPFRRADRYVAWVGYAGNETTEPVLQRVVIDVARR